MKIYTIPVDEKYYLLPKINPFCPHSFGFNVELDFHRFMEGYPDTTTNPNEADWHYLPLYWSYWQLSHNYGKSGREEMAEYLKDIILEPAKTFTISEADNEPNFGINIKVFSGNQQDNGWIAIPIITKPHGMSILPEKKYLSSFMGNTKAWHTRTEMAEILKDRPDVNIVWGKRDEQSFVNSILQSYTTLCPRGSALGSYRFYESMQLGVAPIMISDYDFRPFKGKIDWDSCSYFVDSAYKLPELLDSIDKGEVLQKGIVARKVWNNLYNQGWCRYVLEYL